MVLFGLDRLLALKELAVVRGVVATGMGGDDDMMMVVEIREMVNGMVVVLSQRAKDEMPINPLISRLRVCVCARVL